MSHYSKEIVSCTKTVITAGTCVKLIDQITYCQHVIISADTHVGIFCCVGGPETVANVNPSKGIILVPGNDPVTIDIDDVSKLLAEAAFVVHTADSEGSPNSVIEAMACGRAVVATDVGDVPFLVDDGKTGFVVPRNDLSALVERMEQLMVNPDLCRSMGTAAREKVEREFGLERLVEQTLSVYQAAGWQDL